MFRTLARLAQRSHATGEYSWIATVFVILCLCCGWQDPVCAQPPPAKQNDLNALTVERLQQRIDEIQESKELDEATKPLDLVQMDARVTDLEEIAGLPHHAAHPQRRSQQLLELGGMVDGMDPVATVKRYADRIRYMHMKDIIPLTDPALPWWSGFRELGRGVVNFPAIVDVLDGAGFDGVLCVELDRPRICGYKSAAISRQYIREELGL